jgi:integrase
MAIRYAWVRNVVEWWSESKMAGIYKRGETWWGRITHKGKEHRKSLDTTVKGLAQERFKKWCEELKATGWGEKPRRTFSEAAKRFADEHFSVIKPTSAKRYLFSLVNLASSFESLYLDEITRAKLLDFENKRRREGVTTSTIRRDLRCLSVMFSCADEWEWTDGLNPVAPFLKARQKRGGLKEGQPKTRYLSHKEETALLVAAQRHSMLHAAIIFAIDTGLRDKEQLSLVWQQINLRDREVTVLPGDGTKSGRGRTIPLLPRTLEMLERLPRHPNSQFVFWHGKGKKYLRLYRPLQTAIKRAKIVEHVEWHDMRRTCGCRLLQDYQMPIERVSAWLGHSTITVTEKHYAFLNVAQLHKSVSDGLAALSWKQAE